MREYQEIYACFEVNMPLIGLIVPYNEYEKFEHGFKNLSGYPLYQSESNQLIILRHPETKIRDEKLTGTDALSHVIMLENQLMHLVTVRQILKKQGLSYLPSDIKLMNQDQKNLLISRMSYIYTYDELIDSLTLPNL